LQSERDNLSSQPVPFCTVPRHLVALGAMMGLAVTLVLPPVARAQSAHVIVLDTATTTVTLADIEQLALDSNPDLRSYRLEVGAARADVRTASLRPNPSLGLLADIVQLNHPGVHPDSGNWGATISMPLELGGKRGHRIDVATQLVSVAQLSVADSARRVLLAARLAWYDLAAARARLTIANDVLANWQELTRLDSTRFEAQQVAGVELARAQVALGAAEFGRDEAELAVRMAEDVLARIAGRRERVTVNVALVALDSVPAMPGVDTLEAMALRDRPDVLAARAALAAAVANTRLQQANATISPIVSGDFQSSQGTPLLGVSASVPLPFSSRNQGEREKAAIRVEQSTRQLEAVELGARIEVRTARAELVTRLAALARFGEGNRDGILARARAIRETAAYAYQRGGTSLLELLDAERTYSEVTRAWVDATAQYNRGRAALDAATGADAPRLIRGELPDTR
jgi:outer membrane protein, heavy metal efflux system